jgi:hypothetical protein
MTESARQAALLEAVRGLVNKSPGKKVLLECYHVVNDLHGLEPSIEEARNKLVGTLVETLTNEEDNQMGMTNAMVPSTPPSPTQDAHSLEAMFSDRLAQAITPLEQEIAGLREKLIAKDDELTAARNDLITKESALTDLQKKYEDIERKQQEMEVSMGGKSVEELQAQLDSARNKVIPEMLDENERLRTELEAAQELVDAHTEEADNTRVQAYIETVIAQYPAARKPQIRGILAGCSDVIQVDEALTNLEALIGKPRTRPVKEAGKPQKPGQRPPKKPLKETQTPTRPAPMTQKEAAERNMLPTPKSLANPKQVVSGNSAPTKKSAAQKAQASLNESLGG